MRVLILGGKGRLGAALARAYRTDSSVEALGRTEADLAAPTLVAELVRARRPDAVVNCAALTNVDLCETERDAARTVNAEAPAIIAAACAGIGARLVHVSTDYVFDGTASEPYGEDANPRPLSWYGETKRLGELGVLADEGGHAVVRVSWVFGPDRDSFIDKALQTARRGEPLQAVADKFSSPAYTPDLAEVFRPLLDRGSSAGGVYHACNAGVCTWQDWAQAAIDEALAAGVLLRADRVQPIRLADLKTMSATRPVFTPMACARLEALVGRPMRPWRVAVRDYVRLLLAEGRLG